MINIAVCDDNKVFLDELVRAISGLLQEARTKSNIHTYVRGADLIAAVKNCEVTYDIIILDIDMPQINGLDTAKKLRELDFPFKLIFISSMENEVYKAFRYNADAFIPKKMLKEKLKLEFERILDNAKELKPCMQMFEIENSNGKKLNIHIPLDDIMYFEVINRIIYMHTKKETYTLTQKRFETLKERYISLDFVVIHRTCIVNLKNIYKINETDIILDNEESLPLSRRQRKNVISKLSDFVNKETMYV